MSTSPRAAAPESPNLFRFSLVFFVLASLYLAWPWLSGDVTIPWDSKAHFQPQLSFLAHALHDGKSPFWNPHVFTGMPQIADPQSLIFSPPFLLLAALVREPTFQQADAVSFLMLTLGGIGWMLYFRDRGWSAVGGLVAALAFAYGGSAAWRIQHTGQILSLSWFPLAFWALDRALDRASFSWGMLAGLFAAFMVLGRDQIAWLFVLTLAVFVVWRFVAPPETDKHAPVARLRRLVAPLGGGLLVGLVVAGPSLLWTIALAQQSNRAEITLEGAMRGSLHPASLLTALVADLYGVHGPLSAYWGPPSTDWGETGLYIARNMGEIYFGALPFIALLVCGLARGWAFDRPMRFFSFMATAMAIYAFGKYTPVFPALFDVPGANLFRRPADATFPLCVFAGVIGGYCVSRALGAPNDGPLARFGSWPGLALVGALYLLALGVAVAKGHWPGALPSLAFSAVFAGLSLLWLAQARRWRARPALGLALAGLLLTVDLSLNNAPNQSTALSPHIYDVLREDTANETILFLKQKLKDNAAPDRRDRVELAGIDFHWPNAGLTHGFDMALGYNPIRLTLFVDVTHANDHVAVPEQRMFSPAFPSYKSPMANLFGLRWIATGVPAEEIDKSLKPGDLPLARQTADAYIYENKDALPRVLLPGRAVAADFAAIVKMGGMPDIDYRRNVLIDREICAAQPDLHCAAAASANAEAGVAKILRYDTTLIDVEADAPAQGGFLVLNDIWQNWQSATLDGQPAPILRANLMFRAVALPPGPHHVRFRFEPIRGLAAFWPFSQRSDTK